MMVMVTASLQRRRHFVETDRTVAILVHFAEHVVVAVDDWLCAASSALIVDGDICETPVDPDAGAGLAEVEVLLEASNGFVELWVKPVACGDDDFAFVWVSDLKASITDDAAPRASSIAELRKMPHRAAVASTPIDQQAPCHREKANKIWVFCTPNGHPSPAIDAAAAEFSAHRRAPGAARCTWVRSARPCSRVPRGIQGT